MPFIPQMSIYIMKMTTQNNLALRGKLGAVERTMTMSVAKYWLNVSRSHKCFATSDAGQTHVSVSTHACTHTHTHTHTYTHTHTHTHTYIYIYLYLYLYNTNSVCVSVKYRRPNCWTDHDQIWHAYADRPGNGSYQILAP